MQSAPLWSVALLVQLFLFAGPVCAVEDNEPGSRKRVVIVRPVILCDDDGQNPAACRLPKQLVDRVYTKADIEFLYLAVQHWNYSEARQGKVNLDTIVRRGLSEGVICSDVRVVTLLFVSSVDGHPGPLGRGMQNGNICFVCLGPTPEDNDPDMEAFVVAHEVGHCLNLIHTVDDPHVPDDVPNLQGDGPFEERLAIEGLHDTQRETVLKSPLVNDRIRFYSRADAARQLVDETWEPYLSQAQDDMMRFTLGMSPTDLIPAEPELRRQFVRQQHASFANEFTVEERSILRKQIGKLRELTGDDWPLVSRFPWNFVKVQSGFCNDFPHTRGLAIVLSARALQRMNDDPVYGMSLLLHEKIHVLQRVAPGSFKPLYRKYGYLPFKLARESASRLNLARNPDALTSTWAFLIDDQLHCLATVIATTNNQLVFESKLFPLAEQSDGSMAVAEPVGIELANDWKSRFAIPTGFDHPNEVAAHLSKHLLLTRYLDTADKGSEMSERFADLTQTAFNEVFAVPGDR